MSKATRSLRSLRSFLLALIVAVIGFSLVSLCGPQAFAQSCEDVLRKSETVDALPPLPQNLRLAIGALRQMLQPHEQKILDRYVRDWLKDKRVKVVEGDFEDPIRLTGRRPRRGKVLAWSTRPADSPADEVVRMNRLIQILILHQVTKNEGLLGLRMYREGLFTPIAAIADAVVRSTNWIDTYAQGQETEPPAMAFQSPSIWTLAFTRLIGNEVSATYRSMANDLRIVRLARANPQDVLARTEARMRIPLIVQGIFRLQSHLLGVYSAIAAALLLDSLLDGFHRYQADVVLNQPEAERVQIESVRKILSANDASAAKAMALHSIDQTLASSTVGQGMRISSEERELLHALRDELQPADTSEGAPAEFLN